MTLETIGNFLASLLWSGWTGLMDYLAAHVLLCLVPAFLIAGFMSAMIPKEVITRYLGPKARKWISYPAAAIGGFVLAVCSCTILPLFAGIWRRGAGLGTAITFLFVGPAVNILAIAYTGAAIGMDIALARILLSILFGIIIGIIMAWIFRREESERLAKMMENGLFDQQRNVKTAVWVVFALLIGVLIVGTLSVGILQDVIFNVTIPLDLPQSLISAIATMNLTPQGALLILMLVALAPVARLGLERVTEGFNGWTYGAIAMVAFTLLLAAPAMAEGSLVIGITGRFIGELILLLAIILVMWRNFERHEIAEFLWETWKFVKQIFPLLIVGVTLAGMVRGVLPEAWVQSLAGRNTLWSNLVGVLFGVFMYF
ncbi:MAG: permease, partial [Anaerolineales bacterium]